MLTLRKEQIDTLADTKAENFETLLLDHLLTFFPQRCSQLGNDAVHKIICSGIEKAESYGFESQRDICKYIDLLFVFGTDFDCRSDLPWSRQLLQDRGTRDSLTQMERICQAAVEHLRHQGDRSV